MTRGRIRKIGHGLGHMIGYLCQRRVRSWSSKAALLLVSVECISYPQIQLVDLFIVT